MTRHISLALPTSISHLQICHPNIDAIPRRKCTNQPVRRHILSLPINSFQIQPRFDSILEDASSNHEVKMPYLYQQNTPVLKTRDDFNILTLAQSRHFSESSPKFKLCKSISDISFEELLLDPSITVSPRKLGLIPSSIWESDSITFGILVTSFFRRRNSSSSKFPYKLYNALKISELIPELYPHIGIRWINDDIIWVDRERFARLIGVKTVEGGLFHQQGNFPSHGFVELSFEESECIAAKYRLGHVDLSIMRLVRHINGVFKRGCNEADIEKCKWKGT